MFSTLVNRGKAFAAKQKLKELKKRIFRLKALAKKISKRINPYEIIKKSVDNMNSQLTRKCKQVLNDIEKAEASRERFNFSRLEKISREKNRLEKFDKKKLPEKKIKVKISTRSGKKVLILTAQLKKKDTPGKF